jgi:trimeric autotransporter adhesin
VLGGAVVLAGARLRLQAPLVLGAVVLAAHAVVHLAPYVAALYAQAGLWVTLACVGAVLLTVGAQYERRLNQVRSVGLRLAALR